MSDCSPLRLSIDLSTCLSIYLPACLSVSLSTYLLTYLPLCVIRLICYRSIRSSISLYVISVCIRLAILLPVAL